MSTDKQVRLAVVSDQPIFRRGLSSVIMAVKDVQLVGEVGDGEEALELCELAQPDLLLVDLKTSPNQRADFALSMSRHWPNIKTIFLISPNEDEHWRVEAEAAELLTLSKDISEEELITAVKKLGLGDILGKPRLASTGFADHRAMMDTVDTVQRRIIQPSQEIMARELQTAAKIQVDILPERVPAIQGWDLAARLNPAREISGDFYDFIPLPYNNWGIVIADVTDKGLGASLFMALTSTLMRTYAVRYPSMPALTLDVVNERILADTRSNMFVTAIFGVLEPRADRFRFVNAGHPPGLLVSTQKSKRVERLRPTGMALGVMERARWHQKFVKFMPGDVLLLYTDGITEAQNARGEFFEESRLLDVVRGRSGCSAQAILEAVLAEVDRFTGGAPHQDDIALIVLARLADKT